MYLHQKEKWDHWADLVIWTEDVNLEDQNLQDE